MAAMLRQSCGRPLLSTIVVLSLAIFLWTSWSYAPEDLKESLPLRTKKPKEPPLEYYSWTTVSGFKQTSHEVAQNASIEELCQLFPTEKLSEVQTILKTGHGVLPRVRQSLRTVSACLNNVLILSNFEEVVDGHAVMDVIADIPQKILESDNQTIPYRELLEAKNNGSLKDGSMKGVDGWQTDKFKFLPAISRSWRMAPNRKWYVFYEDDTFVFWDTVFRLLENFDPDVPQYFGSPSPAGENWFANGGPGHILSRGAMKKLVKGDWDAKTGAYLGSKLSETHWINILLDCCGDSVLGATLREYGIQLKGLWPVFNPHPAHGIPFSDLYWCQPVLSLHKTLEHDIDRLWRWSFANTDPFRATTYQDLALGYFNFTSWKPGETREDWDNADFDGYPPEGDGAQYAHESAGSCATACMKFQGCWQWTYHKRECKFVRSFRMGRPTKPSEPDDDGPMTEQDRFIAGWNTVKINKWIDEHQCPKVLWPAPSTTRIF